MALVTFKIDDPIAHLAQCVRDDEKNATVALRQYSRNWMLARAEAFREALQIVDAAQRAAETGEAVPMRDADDIMHWLRMNARLKGGAR